MSRDRPLTDAQEKALILLADRAPAWVSSGYFRIRSSTMLALERKGLAEVRIRFGYGTLHEARITEAGLQMCHSMGD